MEIRIREHYLKGPQKIRQRIEPCRCGCKGRDSQHTVFTRRVVRSIERLDPPQPHPLAATDRRWEGTYILARGVYKHPQGERPCVLWGIALEDSTVIAAGGWRLPELLR
jgi:hypothetical protein